jgi:hypothetical protein
VKSRFFAKNRIVSELPTTHRETVWQQVRVANHYGHGLRVLSASHLVPRKPISGKSEISASCLLITRSGLLSTSDFTV